MISVVEGDGDGPLSSSKQQTLALRILAHRIYIFILRNAAGDLRPGFAAIAGAVNVRPQVVEPQRVDRRVRGLHIEVARFQDRHLLPSRHLRRRDVVPIRSAIGGQPDQAVVGSSPDAIDVQWRGSERVDYAALLGLCRSLRAEDANRRWNFPGFSCEVRADLLPTFSTVVCGP